ncbi:MAG: hypothetical protein SPG07_09350 [Coriobacteriales bacterium]|nr:hypothetical protein [Coriobacteriales bacterium]
MNITSSRVNLTPLASSSAMRDWPINLAETDLGNTEVRYDIVGVFILGESRVLIRHHINSITPLR